ncbi:uncharacterized protein LOC140702201 isoform X1 [Pogona vitticeps]
MLKAGGAGFFFPAVSPQFLPHLPLQHPESVPFARRWETLACTERLDARGRRLGVVLSMNSFTRMQSFIVRLRHLQTRGTTGSRKVGGVHRGGSRKERKCTVAVGPKEGWGTLSPYAVIWQAEETFSLSLFRLPADSFLPLLYLFEELRRQCFRGVCHPLLVFFKTNTPTFSCILPMSLSPSARDGDPLTLLVVALQDPIPFSPSQKNTMKNAHQGRVGRAIGIMCARQGGADKESMLSSPSPIRGHPFVDPGEGIASGDPSPSSWQACRVANRPAPLSPTPQGQGFVKRAHVSRGPSSPFPTGLLP